MDNQGISKIYLDGRHYDRMFEGNSAELDFWINQAQNYGDPVLEIACGTGRVSIALASLGFKITGLDNAQTMLKEAKRKAAEVNVRIQWVQGDMRNFDLGEKYPLIILPANSLCHLIDLEEFESFLTCVRRHLSADGHFIIDVFVPKPELLINKTGERRPFSEYNDPDGHGRVIVTESYSYESDTQIKRIKTYQKYPDADEELEGDLNLRMYFPQELDALLKYNGFTIEHKYGNYNLTNFDSNSGKQLLVCSPQPEGNKSNE